MAYLPCDFPYEPEYRDISDDELEEIADTLWDEWQHDERSLGSAQAAYRKAAQGLRRSL